jgi:hypothetical protein
MSNKKIRKKSLRSKKKTNSFRIVRKGVKARGRTFVKIALKIKSKKITNTSKC